MLVSRNFVYEPRRWLLRLVSARPAACRCGRRAGRPLPRGVRARDEWAGPARPRRGWLNRQGKTAGNAWRRRAERKPARASAWRRHRQMGRGYAHGTDRARATAREARFARRLAKWRI